MTYRSTRIEGDGESYTMIGDLTINGISKPVELAVEFFGTGESPSDNTTRAGFGASGSISRGDFGISSNTPPGTDKVLISDTVNLELDVQLIGPA